MKESEVFKFDRQLFIDINRKYYDLLDCVESKFPDESRHETAKRYIVNAENHSNPPAKAD